MINGANGLARILKAEGVQFVSLFPSCRLNNALGEEGIPLLMMRDERYGVAVADAFSRISGGKAFGVCTLQGGINSCGLEFSTGAISQAFEDSTPLLCLTDATPPSQAGNSHYQADRLFANITKWTATIDDAKRVPEFMARAFTFLKTGRPGPVLLQVPSDLGEYDESQNPYEPVEPWKSQADPDMVKTVVKAILAAKKPVLYVGQGVFYADACAELLQFAELAQIPVITTLKAKSAFPDSHPLSLGTRGEPAEQFLKECDLLFTLGSSLSPNRFSHAIPGAKSKIIIQSTVDTLDLNKSYRIAHALIGDAKMVLKQLIQEIAAQTGGGAKANPGLVAEIAGLKRAMWEKYLPALMSEDTPINPYRLYYELMKVLDPKSSFVSGESGSPRDQLSTIYKSEVPHSFMGWGNVSTLGFSLAAVLAAKWRYPERTCVAVVGDASIGYMLGNLEAPVRYALGVTVIQVNNGGFAGYGPGFWGAGQDPYTCSVSPSSVTNMSAAVGGLGLHAERVEDPKELAGALKRAFDENAHNRPAFIEVICSQYPVWGVWAGMSAKGTSKSQYAYDKK
jgi:acetolactate synthase I/II/III large subunit